MPSNDMQEPDEQTPSDSLPSSSEEYEIKITVTPEGLSVDGSDPLDLSTALKHVIAIVKEHPVSGDAHDELKAGYESP